MNKTQNNFFSLAIKEQALLFGDFTLKSGKKSPYFFNIAALLEGGFLHELSLMYLDVVEQLEEPYEVIFGPAYKGIPIASSLATQLGLKNSKAYPVCFDRKEEKDHGEGGVLIGSVENKRVLVVDDVLTAGSALRNAIKLVNESGGKVVAAVVALDREEKNKDAGTVKESLEGELNIPIRSIASISRLTNFLEQENLQEQADLIKRHYFE
jgi:orotate phosphoribosyltransferase|tara:strand:- start:305 stop:934 length:630 start_codon:yes stop_codon:yes gene_type:complete